MTPCEGGIWSRRACLLPVGSVLVYGGRGAGHVEIRTEGGFVSDFVSRTPSERPLVGVYVKPPASEG